MIEYEGGELEGRAGEPPFPRPPLKTTINKEHPCRMV